jgi:tetratricopeptide (TPR) repeat protein
MRSLPLIIASFLALAAPGCDVGPPAPAPRGLAETTPPLSEPADADSWYRRAAASREAGAWPQALDEARAALRLDPGHGPATRLLVEFYLARRRYAEVAALLEQQVSAGRAEGGTYETLGLACAALGRMEEAEAALARAVELEPRNLRALNNLAAVYARGSNTGKTIETLERAVAVDSTYTLALANLAYAYLKNGDHARAESVLVKLLRADPDHPAGNYCQGIRCNDLGRFDEAARSLERYFAVGGTSALAHLELARALEGMGRPQEAIRQLEQALEKDPTFVEALYRLGQLLARGGERQRAAEVLARFRQWRDRAREAPQAWRQVTYYKQALATESQNDQAHYALGRIYAGQGWKPEAAREFALAVAANPQYLDAWRQLGRVCVELKRPAEAAEAFERAVALAPEDAATWNNLCVAHMASGRLDEALAAFRRALAVAPDDVGLHYNLGSLHRKRGALGEALEEYRRALSLEPGNARIRAAVEELERQMARGQ